MDLMLLVIDADGRSWFDEYFVTGSAGENNMRVCMITRGGIVMQSPPMSAPEFAKFLALALAHGVHFEYNDKVIYLAKYR